LRGWFACGAADTRVRAAQQAVVAAAGAAGLPVHARLFPGRHQWTVWQASLRELLPWLWQGRSG
jgi:S-formylglutathione hydrolase FrmB